MFIFSHNQSFSCSKGAQIFELIIVSLLYRGGTTYAVNSAYTIEIFKTNCNSCVSELSEDIKIMLSNSCNMGMYL